MSALGIYGMSGGFKGTPGAAEGGLMAAKAYKEGGLAYAEGGYANGGQPMAGQDVIKQLMEMLDNPGLSPFEVAEIEKKIMMYQRMLGNPQAEEIMAPAMGQAGIASIGTGDMVPEDMAAGAGGGIVAFAEKGAVNLKDQLSDDTKARRKMFEDRLNQSFDRMASEDSFKESKAAEAETRAAIAESRRNNPYAALTNAGFALMAGSDDPTKRGNPLAELGEAGKAGLGSYTRGIAEQKDLARQLSGQVEKRESGKYARDSIMHNALQSSVNQMDTKELALLKDRTDKALLAQQKDSALYLKYSSLYKDTLDDVKDKMLKQDKFSQQFRKDPAGFNAAAEQEAKNVLGPKVLEILGKTAPRPAVVDPAAGNKANAPVVVTIPAKDGQPARQVQFATKEQADQFKKAANIK
jgi:hypothetical protein